MDFAPILDRHQRIALQFSGGKDSLACLYLLRPWWGQLTVYWTDHGDSFPEALDVIERVRAQVPHFVTIPADAKAVRDTFGLPSDLLPAGATPFGRLLGHDLPLMQDRYSCCFRSVMLPMHERMLADGVTLIIRGQRADDLQKSPLRSGDLDDHGIEYLFPLQDWSAEQVRTYLREHGCPLPRWYQTLATAPDCQGCTAWWEEGKAAYLKQHHPAAYHAVRPQWEAIRAALTVSLMDLDKEMEA